MLLNSPNKNPSNAGAPVFNISANIPEVSGDRLDFNCCRPFPSSSSSNGGRKPSAPTEVSTPVLSMLLHVYHREKKSAKDVSNALAICLDIVRVVSHAFSSDP